MKIVRFFLLLLLFGLDGEFVKRKVDGLNTVKERGSAGECLLWVSVG